MYDTLTLTKQGKKDADFVLKNEHLENWQFVNNGTGEVLAQKIIIPLNEVTEREKTFHNGSIGISYSHKKGSISLTTSLPKLVYGSSCIELLTSDKDKVYSLLSEKIEPYLDADLSDFNVYRLDNSCNLPLSKPIPNYINSISHLIPQRVGTKNKGTFQGETVRVQDKTETIMFYDKINQATDMQKGDKDLVAESMRAVNLLRYEIQNKTPQGIASKKRYGKKLKFANIFSDEVLQRSANLRLLTFEKLLITVPKYDIDFETYQAELKYMREKNPRVMNDFGWYILLREGIIKVSDVAELMQGADYTRQAIYKTVSRLRSLQNKRSKSSKLIDEVYEQVMLKSKVA